jgi:hypothetical protein
MPNRPSAALVDNSFPISALISDVI